MKYSIKFGIKQKKIMSKSLKNRFRIKIWARVSNQFRCFVDDEVGNQVLNQVMDQIWFLEPACDQIRDKVQRQVFQQVYDKAKKDE